MKTTIGERLIDLQKEKNMTTNIFKRALLDWKIKNLVIRLNRIEMMKLDYNKDELDFIEKTIEL
jgi:hypothetical protein